MLGHSKLTTTLDTYVHWTEREECDAEAMLASRVFAKEAEEVLAGTGNE